MERVKVNGGELECEIVGSGEPVLLIDLVLPGSSLPLVAEPALAERFELTRYHKRGWGGSTHTPPPVTIADHARDAAALLAELGVARAHVAGHSSGAAIAAQLALDHPERVQSLVLLELTVLSVPSGEALLRGLAPVFEAYAAGEPARALELFLPAASGLDWPSCEALLEDRMPGAVAQALADADTLFGGELPALADWAFGAEEAARIECATLSVVGAETGTLWLEAAELLRSSLPDVEERRIVGVGHLLHIQRPEPVAEAVANFLTRHPLPAAAMEPAAQGGIMGA
jgi:pimeloyl-ACP methyl ester carboxylesterase